MILLEGGRILGEAYHGKDAALLRCEELIAEIRRERRADFQTDLTPKNCPQVAEMAEILRDKFGFSSLGFRILAPKPFAAGLAALGGGLLGDYSDLTGLRTLTVMSYMPNAYTFPTQGMSPLLSRIRIVDGPSGPRLQPAAPGIVRVTAPLFFAARATPGMILAVILHEIGHNFFLFDGVWAKRAALYAVEALGAVQTLRTARLGDIARVASSIKNGRDVLFVSQAILKIYLAVAALVPYSWTVADPAIQALAGIAERVVAAVLPKALRDRMYEALGRPGLEKAADMKAAALAYVGQLLAWLGGFVWNVSEDGGGFRLFAPYSLPVILAKGLGSKLFGDYRADEIHADAFAARFGYGPESAEFDELMASLGEKKTEEERRLEIEASGPFSRAVAMFGASMDPHPVSAVRAWMSAQVLRRELATGGVPEELEATVLEQIALAERTYAKIKAEVRDTADAQVMQYSFALAAWSEGRASFGDVVKAMRACLAGKGADLPEGGEEYGGKDG